MILLLKYWREVTLAAIVAALLYGGWRIRSIIDANKSLGAEVAAQKVEINRVQAQVNAIAKQRVIDNKASAQAVQSRVATVEKRNVDDAKFKVKAQKPAVKSWLDAPLPAAVIDRLRQ